MCTARLLTVSRSIPCISGGTAQSPPGYIPPPLEADPLDADPQSQILLEADPNSHVACDVCWEAPHPHPHPALWTDV